jgi:hypothetical protein
LWLSFVDPATDGRPTQQPAPQFRAGVDLVQLDVSVLDRERRPVRGLQASDFSIFENGVAHPVEAFAEIVVPDADLPATSWMRDVAPDVRRNNENLDRRLTVIVMDDMTIPPQPQMLNSAREIARKLIDQMGPADLAVYPGQPRRAGLHERSPPVACGD